DLLAERLGVLGLGEHHEVVTADVPDEAATVALRGLDHDLRERADRLVTPRVAIVVVEGLEEVDVELEHRERHAVTDAALELLVDRDVAGQPGERAGRALAAAPLEQVVD